MCIKCPLQAQQSSYYLCSEGGGQPECMHMVLDLRASVAHAASLWTRMYMWPMQHPSGPACICGPRGTPLNPHAYVAHAVPLWTRMYMWPTWCGAPLDPHA